MKLRFFVICYGAKHADLYERIAVRSLAQTLNRAAVPEDAIVSVYSDPETCDRVAEASLRFCNNVKLYDIEPRDNHYDTQNKAFIEEIGRCVKEDAALVIVNPDCFWGDGSLGNLLDIAGEQNICLASPHVRVDKDKFLADITKSQSDISNPALVSLAMKTLHQSWIDADVLRESSNSYFTGIGIRWISQGLYAVSHVQPTIFYARLNAADYGFFAERPAARGLWDHAWPEQLISPGRYRCVGTSDAVFIAELTEAETHVTARRPVNPQKPDEFHRDAAHISANRNVVAIWREG